MGVRVLLLIFVRTAFVSAYRGLVADSVKSGYLQPLLPQLLRQHRLIPLLQQRKFVRWNKDAMHVPSLMHVGFVAVEGNVL